MPKKIIIGCDHVALDLKASIKKHIQENYGDIDQEDIGVHTTDSSNYPEVADLVSKRVLTEEALGILICGTGVGMSIAANRHKGIRAVVCSEPYSSSLSKQHNDSNILCMGSRVVGHELAKLIFDEWIKADYEAGRHAIRVEMLDS
jgi:ribose 5-phosphate isomerase B